MYVMSHKQFCADEDVTGDESNSDPGMQGKGRVMYLTKRVGKYCAGGVVSSSEQCL